MTETLAGVSPSKTEDLLEEPSLAEAAVAGVEAATRTPRSRSRAGGALGRGAGDRP